MKKMPQLTPGNKSIQITSSFYGYNHNEIISNGEMYDMQNLSGDMFPLLTLRKKRGIRSLDVEGQTSVPLVGIHGRDQLVFIRGRQVFYNGELVEGLTLLPAYDGITRKIVSFGAYVCIWPDKMYFNTASAGDYGSMERTWTDDGLNIKLSMCRGDGTDYGTTEIATGVTPPEDPTNGDLWIDESSENDVLRQYSEQTEEWVEVATTFVKIQATGIGANLKEYDAVDLSGLAANTQDARIIKQVDALNGSRIVYFAGNDYIVIAGLISQSQEALATGDVRADLLIPDMDFVCESNNRLWGCKYGLVNGQVVNEIRACKLGDFRNWNCYLGLSTDSYTANVGTDGAFTGAITQRGYPVFFKENCIHRVSGMTPSSFQIQTTIARGVERGSYRSLCVVNENIYYKAKNGIMLYDGNMPQEVSTQLGNVLYSDARAGTLGDKYYISMKDRNNTWYLFTYDTKHGTWYKEDHVRALGFGAADDDLYYIDEENNTLVSVTGSAGEIEEDFDWAAVFDLGGVNYVKSGTYDNPARVRNEKYISQFKIRMYLEPESYVCLWIKYDENPRYDFVCQRKGSSLKTFILPVIPKRCDHFRIKITGHGPARIYDISRIMEVGGDG